MSFSSDLTRHAIRLLGNPYDQRSEDDRNVDLRRAVSAAYYALFHHLSQAAVEQFAPGADPRIASRIQRSLNHAEMKRICKEFASPSLQPPFRDLLTGGVSENLQTVAVNFIKLQEARHSADYDLEYQLSWEQATEFIKLAASGIGAWERINRSAEAYIFGLSLLLRKNWERERT